METNKFQTISKFGLSGRFYFKQFVWLCLFAVIVFACGKSQKTTTAPISYADTVVNDGYTLILPEKKATELLVLFGGFPEDAAAIQREFEPQNLPSRDETAIMLMNFNRSIWVKQEKLAQLAAQIDFVVHSSVLPKDHLVIGGHSSGGLVAMLLGDYLVDHPELELIPKGIFIVDSPVDLLALQQSCERVGARLSNKEYSENAMVLAGYIANQIGDPEKDLDKYEKYGVYTAQTKNIQNIAHLKNVNLRFYTEPDTAWWGTKGYEPEDINAWGIRLLHQQLTQEEGFAQVELIETEGKGYMSHGERNPHHWSIVDKAGLMQWIHRL